MYEYRTAQAVLTYLETNDNIDKIACILCFFENMASGDIYVNYVRKPTDEVSQAKWEEVPADLKHSSILLHTKRTCQV